jgi:carboxyl-terminal processing protease
MRLLKSKKPGMIPGFLFFFLCLTLALRISFRPAVEGRLEGVCDFVAERIYLPAKIIGPWTNECHLRVRKLAPGASVAIRIDTFNDLFAQLHTSHLVMYTPTEATKLWTGESKETGINAFYVQGELVVRKVHSASPAQKAGVRFGDVIKSVNGAEGNPEDVENESGSYVIERHGQSLKVEIKPASFIADEGLQLERPAKGVVVLRVPSFRAEYFAEDDWKKTVTALTNAREIIIDLRGNLGGNFVAGLRFLSPFLCVPTEVGHLIRPPPRSSTRGSGESSAGGGAESLAEGAAENLAEKILPNELDDDVQIDIVNQARRVRLATFAGYPCVGAKAQMDVLVDAGTASTAEMAAQALKDFRHAGVRGAMSAGQLLVGLWYAAPEVGEGVKISIPEAVYETSSGHRIEGPGVKLDEVLYYHLEDFQNGEDSWIKTVSRRNVAK